MSTAGTTFQTPQRHLRVALAGNPNAGKTTIFNDLTGSHQHVGNYPGVTVEKKTGTLTHRDHNIEIVDLPGTYGLTAFSLDERVARRYITHEQPDVVVDVLDASNLERNLYLAVQLMQLEIPLILVLNMSDVAEARGYAINTGLLSKLFDTRIIRTVGHKGIGIDELRDAIVDVAEAETPSLPSTVKYGREVENELRRLIPLIEPRGDLQKHSERWLAVKLLENDNEVREHIASISIDQEQLLAAVDSSRDRIRKHFGAAPETVIADQRYGFISGACQEAVVATVESRHSQSDRIDRIVTHGTFGVLVFLAMMYLMFKAVFLLGEPPMNLLDAGFRWLSTTINSVWPAGHLLWLKSLIIDGIIGGVGGVIVFLPTIAILFAAIAILEDSGYMARAAFIMDKLMHRIGLHGKSFIPMLIGFGCTVPAILATRIMENRRDRLTTMLVLPLCSCGARFPIYALLTAAFFPPQYRARILMILYLTGVVLAIGLVKLIRSTVFKGQSEPFVMELPPYRRPTFRGIATHTWERSWLFLRKAGTVILLFSIILWFLTKYPTPPQEQIENLSASDAAELQVGYSFAGRIGHALEPVMRPIGFEWKTTTALLGAFAAKELFVTQLGIVHAVSDDEDSAGLREILRRNYTQLQAFCIMLFCLISIPCLPTVVTTARESGSWKWAFLQLGGLTLLAYIITFAVYQTGSLFLGNG